MSRLAAVLCSLALLAPVTACKNKDAAAGDPAAGEWADVDCEKMVDHLGGVLLDEATKGKSKAEVDAAKAKMKEQRPTMVAACVKEKPTKKLTQKQYDCLMAANDAAAMQGCQ